MNKKYSPSDFIGMPIKQIAAIVGLPYKTLWERINKAKISFEDAINTPLRKPFIGCSVDGCTGNHEAKGFCVMHYIQWRKNGFVTERKKNPKGSGWINSSDGYKYFNDRQEHILIAEKAFGKKLPKGAVVHHIDGNRLNNSKDNLLVCQDQAYHMLIHQRQRAYDASGNPDYRMCNFCKMHDAPELLYIYKTASYHRECRNKHLRIRKNNVN
jgi:hypothetical protein